MASESKTPSESKLPDIDGCELDASVMFRDEAKDLSTIQNLEAALGRFGYELNDKITRRELVLIYKKIKDAMEKQIFHLANVENRYPEAKEMRQRQIALRSEFDFLQKNAVLTNLKEQEIAFQKAEELMNLQLDQKHKQEVAEMEEYVRRKTEQEEFFYDIQTSNLTQTLDKTHRPNLRLNKRLIELHRAETGLNRLKQYDDALKVRKMIDKLLPDATNKFFGDFETSQTLKLTKLSLIQDGDRAKLEEKMKKFKWNKIRERERELALSTQRLKNHKHDMDHMHSLETKLKPEMSVKPSALWQHRAGYANTSASLRGVQLHHFALGKKVGSAVYATPLTDRHNYLNAPQDTVEFDALSYTVADKAINSPLSPTYRRSQSNF